MYKTKFYSNDGTMTVLARSQNARTAYEAHKKALSLDYTEEAQAVIDVAWIIFNESSLSLRTDLHLLSDEETNNLAIERQRKFDEVHENARSLTPFYPEDPTQIITTNSKGIIVGYGNDMQKLRKTGKIPSWM